MNFNEVAKKNYYCKEGGRFWSSKSINGGSCNIDDCYLDFIINDTTNSRFALYRGINVDARSFMSVRCVKDYH